MVTLEAIHPLLWKPPPYLPDIPRPTSCALFTSKGVTHAALKLHDNRAKDHEGLCTEFIAYSIKTLAPILAKLFNEVVYCKFSNTWTLNTIMPIHIARDPMDPRNYMTITIGHFMSKIYAVVLDGKVSASAEMKDSEHLDKLRTTWLTTTF